MRGIARNNEMFYSPSTSQATCKRSSISDPRGNLHIKRKPSLCLSPKSAFGSFVAGVSSVAQINRHTISRTFHTRGLCAMISFFWGTLTLYRPPYLVRNSMMWCLMTLSMLTCAGDVEDIKRSTISTNARCCSSTPDEIWLMARTNTHACTQDAPNVSQPHVSYNTARKHSYN